MAKAGKQRHRPFGHSANTDNTTPPPQRFVLTKQSSIEPYLQSVAVQVLPRAGCLAARPALRFAGGGGTGNCSPPQTARMTCD